MKLGGELQAVEDPCVIRVPLQLVDRRRPADPADPPGKTKLAVAGASARRRAATSPEQSPEPDPRAVRGAVETFKVAGDPTRLLILLMLAVPPAYMIGRIWAAQTPTGWLTVDL